MLVRSNGMELLVGPGDTVTFGRRSTHPVPVGVTPPDQLVSRDAGSIKFQGGGWRLSNTGSRSFFLVEPGEEIELPPPARGHRELLVDVADSWIRVTGTDRDHAIELLIPDDELPIRITPVAITLDMERTIVEGDGTTLTDNELRSVIAIYEHYLLLPPHYRREPRSFRAAGKRIGAEEGKVKADLRRVQQKVAAAGGPAEGGARYRDALISWLLSRGVVRRSDLPILDQPGHERV